MLQGRDRGVQLRYLQLHQRWERQLCVHTRRRLLYVLAATVHAREGLRSCIDSTCVVDTEGNVVCTGGPCRIVGCTASVRCQPGEVCVSGSGWCCHPCP